MKKVEKEFECLVGKIQTANQALRQDALGIINRSVTTRAWLTGYYIVEFEQGGKARAAYGDGLLKRLSERLGVKDYSVHTLKKYREFYRIFPKLAMPIRDYLIERFGKGYSTNIQLSVMSETISCNQEPKVCQIGYSPNTSHRLLTNGYSFQSTCYSFRRRKHLRASSEKKTRDFRQVWEKVW